jgi:hypothetical protein
MKRRLLDALEGGLGRVVPLAVWRKLFHLSMRTLHRRGDEFVTHHLRPKSARDVGVWSDPLVTPPRVAVVIQGPLLLADDFTLETVRLYRKTFAGCDLVVSTWESADARAVAALRDAGAEVLLNRPPAVAGFKNTNLQLTSALAGVKRAKELGAAYVLKTRTDQRMYAPGVAEFLVNVAECFPVAPGYRQNRRLVGTSLASHKYIMYQFSDMNVFGDVDDVLLYYSAPPTPTTALPPDFRDVLGEAARVNAPEHHLATHFLERVGRPVAWTLDASWRALADHFVVVDRHSLDLVWFKYGSQAEYPAVAYANVPAAQELSFREWLNLYQGLGNKADVGRYEVSQGLGFAEAMPDLAVRP